MHGKDKTAGACRRQRLDIDEWSRILRAGVPAVGQPQAALAARTGLDARSVGGFRTVGRPRALAPGKSGHGAGEVSAFSDSSPACAARWRARSPCTRTAAMVTDLAASAVESVPGLGAGDVGGVAKTHWRTRLPLGVVRIDATAVAVHRPVHLPDAGSGVGAYSPYKAQAVVLIAQTETGMYARAAGRWLGHTSGCSRSCGVDRASRGCHRAR